MDNEKVSTDAFLLPLETERDIGSSEPMKQLLQAPWFELAGRKPDLPT
jgi:hypothetical protein